MRGGSAGSESPASAEAPAGTSAPEAVAAPEPVAGQEEPAEVPAEVPAAEAPAPQEELTAEPNLFANFVTEDDAKFSDAVPRQRGLGLGAREKPPELYDKRGRLREGRINGARISRQQRELGT